MAELVPFGTLMQRPDTTELAKRMFGLGDGSTPEYLAQFMALTYMCVLAGPEEEIHAPPRNPSTPPVYLGYATSGCVVFYVQGSGEDSEDSYAPWVCTLTLGASLSIVFQSATDNTKVFYQDDSWTVPGAVVSPPVPNADGTVTVTTTVPADAPAPQTADLGWPEALHAMLARSLWLPVRQGRALGR